MWSGYSGWNEEPSFTGSFENRTERKGIVDFVDYNLKVVGIDLLGTIFCNYMLCILVSI